MEISLDLVTEAARRRLAAVTPEVAGYIILLATRELEARLFRVSATNLALSETGEVRAHPEGWMSEREVEMALRELLASLLSLSPSPSPSVLAVAERGENTGLHALSAELTAALIPINHAAAQRALARLFRETRRARDAVEAAPEQVQGLELARLGRAGTREAGGVDASGPGELDIDVEVDDGSNGAGATALSNPPSATISLSPTASNAPPSSVLAPIASSEAPAPEAPSPAPDARASAAAPAERTPAEASDRAMPTAPAIAPPPSAELEDAAAAPLAIDAALPPESLTLPPRDPTREPLQQRLADGAARSVRAAVEASLLVPLDIDVVEADVRSDVDVLIAAFLSHTRAESAITLALRRLVGVEPQPGLA